MTRLQIACGLTLERARDSSGLLVPGRCPDPRTPPAPTNRVVEGEAGSPQLRRAAYGCVFLLSIASLCGCEPTDIGSEWRRIDPPVPAASFTLNALDGPPVALADLKDRIVVMEFWATWCTPCRFSLPSLEVIGKRYRDRGISVLLINLDEESDKVRAWAERRFTVPILLDKGGEVADRYGVQSIPRLFVIDQAGRIVWAHQGYGGGLEATLSQILDELLTPPKA